MEVCCHPIAGGTRRTLSLQHALFPQKRHGLHLGMNAELGIDVAQVLLHRLAGHDEHLGRLSHRSPVGHHPQHIQLALG